MLDSPCGELTGYSTRFPPPTRVCTRVPPPRDDYPGTQPLVFIVPSTRVCTRVPQIIHPTKLSLRIATRVLNPGCFQCSRVCTPVPQSVCIPHHTTTSESYQGTQPDRFDHARVCTRVRQSTYPIKLTLRATTPST